MKLMSFLAGVGAGILLNRGLGSRPSPRAGTAGPVAGTTDAEGRRGVAPPGNDQELRERIRARLARTIPNADAVQVEVKEGHVTLRGEVQARSSVLLMAEIEITSGVKSIDNQLKLLGSLEEIAPPHGAPAVREAERETSQLS